AAPNFEVQKAVPSPAGPTPGGPALGGSGNQGIAFDKTAALGQQGPLSNAPQGSSGGYGLGALAAAAPPATAQPNFGATVPLPAQSPLAAPAPSQSLAVSTSSRGPIGTTRNPVVTLLISMVCFVYAIVATI